MLNPFLLFFQGPTAVPQIADPSNFTAAYEALVPTWMAAVFPYAQELFGALAFLDIALAGYMLIRKHGANDISGAIMSMSHRLVLVGAFLALLMNGSSWMGYIIAMFVQVGTAGSGVAQIQPSVVLQRGIDIGFTLLGQGALSGVLQGPVVAFCFVFAGLVIPFSFLVITIDFVVTKIQTFLALGMGIFFLGFGGSSWTRNYVERYFAYAVSSGVRLMTQYFLIGAGLVLSSAWITQAKNAAWSIDGVKQAFLVMFGAVLYATLCLRGSAIAAQLLGGGPNLSHSEAFHAMGSAVQAGVTAALVGSGVGAAAGIGAGGGAAAAAGSSGASAATAVGGSAGTGSTPASQPPRYKREWEERHSSLLAGRMHWKIICAALVLLTPGSASRCGISRGSPTPRSLSPRRVDHRSTTRGQCSRGAWTMRPGTWSGSSS